PAPLAGPSGDHRMDLGPLCSVGAVRQRVHRSISAHDATGTFPTPAGASNPGPRNCGPALPLTHCPPPCPPHPPPRPPPPPPPAGKVAGFTCRSTVARATAPARRPPERQEDLRDRLLAYPASPALGCAHHSRSSLAVRGFRKRLPRAPSEYLEPYLARVRRG